MNEEKSLFKKDRRRDFYIKVLFFAKKINIVFLYFCIVMNIIIIAAMVIGDPNVGIIFFVMNTWFLIFLRLKLKGENVVV